MKRIGILYIGIGKYVLLWDGFIKSAEKYLFPDAEKHYFVFTDRDDHIKECKINIDNISIIHQDDLGWPKNVLYRYKMLLTIKEELSDLDYLFFFNGNTIFNRTIYTHELVPTQEENYISCLYWHYFYAGKLNDTFPYERNKESTAYISYGKGKFYYQAGLVGGRSTEYLDLLEWGKTAVEEDERNGIVSVDEPYLNRYLLDREPVKVLNTMYGKPEEWIFPLKSKIVFRDKDRVLGNEYMNNLKGNISKKKFFLKQLLEESIKCLRYLLIKAPCRRY